MMGFKYFCLLLGEDFNKARHYHEDSLRRLRSFAIAIHLPVLLWLASSFTIGTQIFGLPNHQAAAIAVSCAFFIYMVERLVLATPSNWLINTLRVLLGLAIAIIGSSFIDLVLFDREINQQLHERGEQLMRKQHASTMSGLEKQVLEKRRDWLEARQQAQCEADGRCGGRSRGTGPIYKVAEEHAKTLQKNYESAQAELEKLRIQQVEELVASRNAATPIQKAGLLARIRALHEFVREDTMTQIAYGVLFMLVASMEFMVVIVKYAFRQETIDDRLHAMRAKITESKGLAYVNAVTSPMADAKNLLHQTF